MIETFIRLLSMLTRLHCEIHKANATTVPSIVQELCYFVSAILQGNANTSDKGISESQRDNLASEALYCVLDWVMFSPNVFTTKGSLNSVFGVIRAVLSDTYVLWPAESSTESTNFTTKDTAKKKTLRKKKQSKGLDEIKEAEPKVKEAAQCLYYTLMYHFLRFPASQGPVKMSSSITEESEVAALHVRTR